MKEEAGLGGASSVAKYTFLRHLATGGMADVYIAEAVGVAGVTRRVAVKRVLREYMDDPEFLRMFTNEARLSVHLQHPHIVQTYDVLAVNGELYITMELLEGLPMLEVLRLLGDERLGTARSVYVIDRILAGLHYAHERVDLLGEPLGIVHRDVSPHNVFLTLDGNIKLLDFGVAKVAAQDTNTQSGVVKGKVLYMSPEHCQGKDVDRRADVFSAGVLLYTLLVNRHPFRGKTPYDTMRAVIHDLAAPPSTVAELPEGFDRVVLKALSKDPDQRYPTAAAFRADLHELVKQHQLHVSDTEIGLLVENLLPTAHVSEVTQLPDDLVLGVPQVHTGRHPAADAALAETSHGIVERIFGLTLLRLRGVLDETFDPVPLVPHLQGTLLVDTQNVQRITSYGIRGLLQLYSNRQLGQVVHIRASVPFVQQVGMVRPLLGGGTIASFHLPYVDPVNGFAFSVLLEGEQAQQALDDRAAPPWTCPGYPDRDARFDESPGYFDFHPFFTAEPDPEIQAVIIALDAEGQRRQVEKDVDEEGTHIWIRCPLTEAFRWKSLLSGLEGRVHIDMEDTPSWTEAGVNSLLQALAKSSSDIRALRFSHAPYPLIERLVPLPLVDKVVDSTARVHGLCAGCGVPRRVAVALEELEFIHHGSAVGPCPACGGELRSTEDFGELWPKTASAPMEGLAGSALPVGPIALGLVGIALVGGLIYALG